MSTSRVSGQNTICKRVTCIPARIIHLHRIDALAALRNLALQPLVEHPEQLWSGSGRDLSQRRGNMHGRYPGADPPEDVPECRHDLRNGLDICWSGSHVLRCMDLANHQEGTHSSISHLTGAGSHAWNLFWNDAEALRHQEKGQPFQVFACWNGAVVVTAKPLIEGLKFRAARGSECFPRGTQRISARSCGTSGIGRSR